MSGQLVAETSTWQHVTLTTDKYPCPRWDSNPRSQQVSGRRPLTYRDRGIWIPPGAWIFVCCECRVLSGRGLCDELITRPEEYYRLWCVIVCDLETSRIGVPYIYIYIYDISSLRVKCLWENNLQTIWWGLTSWYVIMTVAWQTVAYRLGVTVTRLLLDHQCI